MGGPAALRVVLSRTPLESVYLRLLVPSHTAGTRNSRRSLAWGAPLPFIEDMKVEVVLHTEWSLRAPPTRRLDCDSYSS